jgi:hypothetical protein
MSIATTNEIKEAIKIAVLAYKYPNLNYPEEDKVALYPLDAATHDPGAAYRPERFDYAGNILYRPGIVRNLQDAILTLTNREFGSGILVNGPQGVGKSHSLVNLVRRLRGHGHIVTFIPDVEQWDTGVEFIDFICRSLGTDSVALGITEAMATDNGLKTLCSIETRTRGNQRRSIGFLFSINSTEYLVGRNFRQPRILGFCPFHSNS